MKVCMVSYKHFFRPEALIEGPYAVYGYTIPLDYAMNYIEMNEYATVDDFHY